MKDSPLLTLPKLLRTIAVPAALAGLLAISAPAAERLSDLKLDDLPHYQSGGDVSGVIRVGGHAFERPIIQNWEKAFHELHPGVTFVNKMAGTSTGVNSVALDVTDIAFIGREIWHIETQAFWRGKHRVPLGVKVTSGTYSIHGDSAALALFVNKANPIRKITLAQADAILGAEHLRGPRNFRQWGDMGLTGEWAHRTINVYGDWLDSGEAEFVKETVLMNSNLWNADHYTQAWNDIELPNKTILKDDGRQWITDKVVLGTISTYAGQKIIRGVANDPAGFGYTTPLYKDDHVRRLAISPGEGKPYIEATLENVYNRSYPLVRSTYVYLDQIPGQPLNPAIKEFLSYILSQEAQTMVRDGKMVPLCASAIAEEQTKLQ